MKTKAFLMEKAYNHKETEKKLYKTWDRSGSSTASNHSEAPFSMVLPPPQITGRVHMGNILTFIIPDIIIRRKRMQGFDCLWMPLEGRRDTAVQEAVERLGLSMDWDQKKSLPDEKLQEIVNRDFVQLYNDGEIYRGPGKNQRSHPPGEPPASKQWFLKTSRIARAAGDVVKREKLLFFPPKWKRIYLRRLDGIQDWCISHQSGEGLQIPAFYCRRCNHLMVAEAPPPSCEKCGCTHITRDPDVFAPWFASALQPLTAPDLPISLLTATRDIFFSYITQTIMMGVHFHKESPFSEILIMGMIRDEKGRKMDAGGKNTVDPLETINTFGSDTLRFTLTAQSVPGKDISFSVSRLKGYRAFANKIWNAARYVIMNLQGDEDCDIDFSKITSTDRWILNGLTNTVVKLNELMDSYKIYKAARLLYSFIRDEYCGWYLEFSKNDINNLATRKTLKFTLVRLLQLIHPFMPFISEEIYSKLAPGEIRFLLQTEFPSFSSKLAFTIDFSHVELLKRIIKETRKTRTENQVHPRRKVNIYLATESQKERKMVEKNIRYFDLLTKSAKTEIVNDFSSLARGFRGVYRNWEILLPFDSEENRQTELARLNKETEKLDERIAGLEEKLSKKSFTDNAPEQVVSDVKKNLQESIDKRNKIRKTIDDLS